MNFTSHPQLSINKTALVENWRTFCKIAPNSDITAVVKSDAYGLGAQEISKALYQGGCRIFFCATVPECLEVLQVLPKDDDSLEIATFGGFFLEEMLDYQSDNRLVPVLNTKQQIQDWRNSPRLHNREAYVHIDTGINRLGIRYDQWDAVQPLLNFPIRALISHLATADEDTDFANIQLQRFLPSKDYPRSLSNTAGAFLGEKFHLNMLRLGIGLYGVNTAAPQGIDLHPALSLDAPILQIRHVLEGETVGYGQTYRAMTTRRMATVGIGYNDGLPRDLSNHQSFFGWWQGSKLEICGRISMDSLVLDITDHPEIHETSRISFLNSTQAIDDLAKACNTIPHEALTRLGGRIERMYTE